MAGMGYLEAQEWLRKIEFVPGFRFYFEEDLEKKMKRIGVLTGLTVSTDQVTDVWTEGNQVVAARVTMHTWIPWDQTITERFLAKMVWSLTERLVLHEAQERLKHSGKWIYDPHPERIGGNKGILEALFPKPIDILEMGKS